MCHGDGVIDTFGIKMRQRIFPCRNLLITHYSLLVTRYLFNIKSSLAIFSGNPTNLFYR